MRVITDKNGRKYEVNLDVDSIHRVKSRVGIDLLSPLGGVNAIRDPQTMLRVVHAIAFKRMDAVAWDDFQAGFDGDSIESAAEVLVQELIDFLPKEKARVMRAILDQGKAIDLADARLLAQMTATLYGRRLISRLASLASTPAHSLFAALNRWRTRGFLSRVFSFL